MRGRVAVLLGVHLLGAGAVPLADARLESALPVAEVHVEDAHEGACTPAHDHQTCALCQHLVHGAGLTPTPGTTRPDHESRNGRTPSADRLAHHDVLSSPLSRAPPSATAFLESNA
jgi:hypothetical protein